MKRLVTIFGLLLATGCATVQSGDALRIAALHTFGLENVAWITNNTAALPSGMDSVVSLKSMRAHIDNIAVEGSSGIVRATYRYEGTFSTADGNRDGVLTVQRRLRFTRGDRDTWTLSAPPEEIARNMTTSGGAALRASS